ncbi:MAG: ATP-binding protein, partial [bacterium]|nr:ATP-binding protein [bacterium]
LTATKRDESVTFLLQKEFGKKFEDKITSFLTAADTGIQEVGLERAEMTASDFPVELPETVKKQFLEGGVYRTIAFHKLYDGEKEMGNIAFDLGEESIGTQRMYDLAGDVIFILETGGALIVDELDQSLHPHLCEYILQLFNDPETNPNNAQLIATTHDTTLLNPQLLRRDQIWFVTKDRMGASELFSLDEFKRDSLRNNTPFDKWYLEGRLGAIPNIDKTVFKVTAKDRKGNPDA